MWRRLLKIVGYCIVVLLVILVIGHYVFLASVRIDEPEVDKTADIPPVDTIAPFVYTCGDSWLVKDDSEIWIASISGAPYERGLVYGALCGELARKQEDVFVAQTQLMVGTGIGSRFLKYFVGWFNRDIDQHVPDEYLQEIYGASRAFSDDYDWIAGKYQRLLNYHAAHDIGHAMEDLVNVGCSSFAATGSYSADSSMIVGRNFDFYMGSDFAKQRLLLINRPDEGIPYASYSWAGMLGVVSGINAAGLTVTINAAKSELPTGAKTPISILAREVLQYASTLEDAIAICKRRELFVSESILVSSGTENKAIIIEVSPSGLDTYESTSDLTLCTNHYQSDLFRDQKFNLDWLEMSDSRYRFELLDSLIYSAVPLHPSRIAEILSATRGKGGADIGLANPKAINQLIGHHSVIFQPSKRLFWLSGFPNPVKTGFYGFDLNALLTSGPLSAGSADSLRILPSRDQLQLYSDFIEFINTRERIMQSIYGSADMQLSDIEIDRFIRSNPNSYLTYMTLGQYYIEEKEEDLATEYLNKSLEYELPSLNEKNRINELLNFATSK